VNSLKVISLFSGAGGMDIGFKAAGFEIAVAIEQDSSCCETLRHNNPGLPLIEGDIRELSSEEILLKAKLNVLDAAVLIGGPR
jgi:DNA (cytosine-5)-methyltransferase 1